MNIKQAQYIQTIANEGSITAAAKKLYISQPSLSQMVHGFDFARLITLYYRAFLADDDETRGRVIKWFRGEYGTKTESRQELGVNVIITDDDWYDYLKLFAMFFRLAGYNGLLIFIDELVNIYKIPQSVTRQYNYEKILTMYNDTLQGRAKYLGIIMCGTPQCIEDTRRGVYSYEALRSRLQEGRFGRDELKDVLAPVIRLSPLTNEEMLVLTEKLTEIHGVLFDYEPKLTQEDLVKISRLMLGEVEKRLVERGIELESDEEAVRRVGRRYRDTLLALGGGTDPMEVFRLFRGRAPETKALLRQTGLLPEGK